jgi:hypothetical protein
MQHDRNNVVGVCRCHRCTVRAHQRWAEFWRIYTSERGITTPMTPVTR